MPNNTPRPRPPCTSCGGPTTGRGKSGLCLPCWLQTRRSSEHGRQLVALRITKQRQDRILADKYRKEHPGE